jgi:hypothetical protein
LTVETRLESHQMTRCVFVDESKRRDFVLVAGAVPSHDINAAQEALQRLCKPGQRGIHMAKESPGRQRKSWLGVATETATGGNDARASSRR